MKEKEEKNVGEKNKKRKIIRRRKVSDVALIFLSHIFLFYILFMPFMEAYELIRPNSE